LASRDIDYTPPLCRDEGAPFSNGFYSLLDEFSNNCDASGISRTISAFPQLGVSDKLLANTLARKSCCAPDPHDAYYPLGPVFFPQRISSPLSCSLPFHPRPSSSSFLQLPAPSRGLNPSARLVFPSSFVLGPLPGIRLRGAPLPPCVRQAGLSRLSSPVDSFSGCAITVFPWIDPMNSPSPP